MSDSNSCCYYGPEFFRTSLGLFNLQVEIAITAKLLSLSSVIILILSLLIIFKVSHLSNWATCPVPANLPNSVQRSSLSFVVIGLLISLHSVVTVNPFALLTLNRFLLYSTFLDYFLIVSSLFCISAVVTVFTHKLLFSRTP
jgi:hypothetical protein